MKTLELKQELIDMISGIDDPEFLLAIKTIINVRKKELIIELTAELENELLLSSEEGKKGIVFSQEEMDKKVQEWLEE